MNDIATYLRSWLSDPLIRKIIAVMLGIIAIYFISLLGRRAVLERIKGVDTRYRFRKMIGLFGVLTSILLISVVFSDRLGNLTVAFGVAGAGIAFALQEIISSLAGWVAVSLGNFYSVGDRVQLGGITGDVIDIGVLRTTVMETGQWVKSDLYNGRIVRIANSFVFKEPVFNYSADFPFLWDEITVPVKHGSDHRLAKEKLLVVAKELVGGFVPDAREYWQRMVSKYMIEKAVIEPMVTLIATDNWLEFTVRYVVEYKKRRLTKDLLYTRILDEFEATEGKVSIASTTMQLVGAPVLNVKLAEDPLPNKF